MVWKGVPLFNGVVVECGGGDSVDLGYFEVKIAESGVVGMGGCFEVLFQIGGSMAIEDVVNYVHAELEDPIFYAEE